MTYLESYTLAKDPQLTQRLVGALVQQCTNVWVEVGTTPSHAQRLALVAYAGPRMSDFERFSQEIALLLCVLNPTISVETPDADLVTMLSGIWTPFALILEHKGLITVPEVA